MTKEKINEYTLRISQANRSEIIVILYDMAIQYINDACESFENNDYNKMRENCGYAGKVVSDLIGSLRYDNELAFSLQKCYVFIQSRISLSLVKRNVEDLMIAKRMLSQLKSSFDEIARQDTTGPVMGNSETVYVGYTYGKRAYLDNLTTEVSRGFKV